jgi:hypothetical protein
MKRMMLLAWMWENFKPIMILQMSVPQKSSKKYSEIFKIQNLQKNKKYHGQKLEDQ